MAARDEKKHKRPRPGPATGFLLQDDAPITSEEPPPADLVTTPEPSPKRNCAPPTASPTLAAVFTPTEPTVDIPLDLVEQSRLERLLPVSLTPEVIVEFILE